MPLGEAERRGSRRSTPSDDATTEESDDRRVGVALVATVGLLSGLADLGTGLLMSLGPLFVVGVPVAGIGAVKCWAAIGLYRLRPRAVGLTALFFGVAAMLAAGRVLFALRAGDGVAAPAINLAIDLAVVGYVLVLVDEVD
ncbi:hypothetical protein ACFQMF_04670 [Halorubrum rutilum]|uniref:Uncharacterized protein n=1 Tax=Halorubrum rutilum TaxID=1364933 RepID=A0ABD6AHU3_9EURY|nr:hypothetical protein [Halorubrum rutilum]